MSVLMRSIAAFGAAAAGVVCASAIAAADPPPVPAPQPPPPPNVNALAPVKLSEYAAMNNTWYAFSGPGGVTCVLQKGNGYGCSGPIPGAPEGANLVSGAYGGVPAFASAPANVFGDPSAVKPLPVGSRISYQTVSCGNDGTAMTCVDQRNQSGFVISPAGSVILNETNPLLDRPEGANPYFN
jgi:hypothetical protein